jgi:hypothetical protein
MICEVTKVAATTNELSFTIKKTHPCVVNLLRFALSTVSKKILDFDPPRTPSDCTFLTDDEFLNYPDAFRRTLNMMPIDQNIASDATFRINVTASAYRVVTGADIEQISGTRAISLGFNPKTPICILRKNRTLVIQNIHPKKSYNCATKPCIFTFTRKKDTCDMIEACTEYDIKLLFQNGCDPKATMVRAISDLIADLNERADRYDIVVEQNYIMKMEHDQLVLNTLAHYMYAFHGIDAQASRSANRIFIQSTSERIEEIYRASLHQLIETISNIATHFE